jgi:catechol 2,3-dioxygenase-like lactoylglutathione lyase family enzyme
MIKHLWNIGVKTSDLDADLEFLQKVGATMVLRDVLAADGDQLDYAIVRLAGVRLLLFPSVIFEDRVPGGVAPGLTHAVFEVDDLDAEYARIRGLGGEVLIEPQFAQGGFGTRRLAFFRAPGGMVFEVMQVLERGIE